VTDGVPFPCYFEPVEREGNNSRSGNTKASIWVRGQAPLQKDALLTQPLELSSAAAEELGRIARFALVALHELRTPMTSALASLGMLVDGLDPADRGTQARLIRNVFKSVRILKGRTDDLQDIVDFRSGAARLQLGSVDMGQLVKDTVSGFVERALSDGVRIDTGIVEGLPRVICDASRVSQVVAHFLQNALDYASDGGRIDVRLLSGQNLVRIDVQDYGQGIRPEKRMEMLQPEPGFEQSAEVAGMGIGMELSKIITEQHRGRIIVDSKEGKGSLFSVELPLL